MVSQPFGQLAKANMDEPTISAKTIGQPLWRCDEAFWWLRQHLNLSYMQDIGKPLSFWCMKHISETDKYLLCVLHRSLRTHEYSLHLSFLVRSLSTSHRPLLKQEIHRIHFNLATHGVHRVVRNYFMMIAGASSKCWAVRWNWIVRYHLCYYALTGDVDEIGTHILRDEFARRYGVVLNDGWIVMNYWVRLYK